ncbi:hypothetical protein [Burkholderia pseudomultivorans]|uniref:hypothetical protein n=1 Tax=Burkholderia pseudomultivorans TaxID=1207504 RepID=UPI0012DB1505|nr:hypothetical protein [Burkholderia pseudomultivorans]
MAEIDVKTARAIANDLRASFGSWTKPYQAANFLTDLCDRLEAAEKDAERYRWLRDNKHLDAWWSVTGPTDRCENIDADIDGAMTDALAQRQGEGS